jgi:glycosyltransferase involved in cell wall biosynthesis
VHSANGNNGEGGRRLSVVIPVFNEHATLAELVRRVHAVPLAKEIILVDDGSTDGTRELLAQMAGAPNVRVIYHDANRGKGAALKTGFLLAQGDIVIVQDADLEYDPADYPRLIEPILQDRADVVFGSRFANGDARGVQSSLHRLGNRVLTTLSNLATNLKLTDMETCYKVFRRDVIHRIAPHLEQERFGIEPEITARVARAGYRVVEVGIGYCGRSRRDGKKIGWRDGVSALWCILRYSRWRR